MKLVSLVGESTIKAEQASDGYLLLLRDVQIHFGQQTNYYHFVRKIHSEVGVQNGSEIEFTYDPSYQKLVFHEVKIIREGKSFNRLDASKFKVFQRETSKESYLYDESLTALLILEDIRAGDLIEYSFSCVGRNPIYKQKNFTSFYLQDYDPLDRLFMRVISPVSQKLNITYYNTHTQPQLLTENGHLVYEWDLQQIPGLAVDAEVPSGYDPYPRVWLSEYHSWSEVKDWALGLYQVAGAKGLVAQKAAQIKSRYETPEKRLEAAIRFVQDEIRYTGLESGISGYQPRAPDKVMEQRFGDCKDKSLLLSSLLQQMGIEAHPALVNTRARGYLHNWAPSPVAFDHCIVQVQWGGKSLWYDPTIANQRGTYNTIYCPNYKKALVIRRESNGLTDIPLSDNARVKVKEHFKVDSVGGKTGLVIETQYLGYEADGQRYYYANNNLKEIEKNYLNYYAKHYPKIKVSKALSSSDDAEANVFTTYEEYEIEDFFFPTDSAQPANVECMAFPQALRDKIFISKNPIRTMPIGLTFPTNYEHLTKIYLPVEWNIEPDTKTIEDSITAFSREVSYENKVVSILYKYRTLTNQVNYSQLATYTKNQNQIIDMLGYGLTYTLTPSQTDSGFRLNGIMALLAVLFSVIIGYGAMKLHQYDPEPESGLASGEEIGGWLILFAIGLSIPPIRLLWGILNNDYFDLDHWEQIAYSGSAAYNPGLQAMLIGELFGNLIILVSSILLIILFFNRRSSFPRLVSYFYAFNILFLFTDSLIAPLVSPNSETNIWQSTGELVKLIVTAAIWIPYFRVSRRVKDTFVNTLQPPEGMIRTYRMRV